MAPCKQVLTKTGNTYATQKRTYIYDELHHREYNLLLCLLVDHTGSRILNIFLFPQVHAPGAYGYTLAN